MRPTIECCYLTLNRYAESDKKLLRKWSPKNIICCFYLGPLNLWERRTFLRDCACNSPCLRKHLFPFLVSTIFVSEGMVLHPHLSTSLMLLRCYAGNMWMHKLSPSSHHRHHHPPAAQPKKGRKNIKWIHISTFR